MNFLSVGDLALTYQNRRQVVRIKADLARLGNELATGRKSDLSELSGGDFSPVSSLQNALAANRAYSTSIAEAGLFASSMQATLGSIQSMSEQLGPALLMAGNSEHPAMIRSATADARSKFEAVVSAFNTQVAGRYAFSGAATDQPALASADTIIQALAAATASATTAAGIEAAVDAWFDTPGGGFDTTAYTGSGNLLAPFALSESDMTSIPITAADTEIREILKGYALAALIDDGALNANVVEQAALTRCAGERILSADSVLAELQARVGTSQSRIEAANMRNAAARTSLELALNELTAVDPYRAATELEAARGQLDTLYTLTVRLARLSMSEYLR